MPVAGDAQDCVVLCRPSLGRSLGAECSAKQLHEPQAWKCNRCECTPWCATSMFVCA